VEFRLLYEGQLKGASRNDTRAELKHEIRRVFHPQLRHLWCLSPTLRTMLRFLSPEWLNHHPETIPDSEPFRNWNESELEHFGQSYLAEKWARYGYNCIPLITEEICLRCSLDILFLRPEEPGAVIQGGDIDNRIKTLFDALRLPKTIEEVNRQKPTREEDPFYCLLEDDSLISEIKVSTDRLLLLPKEKVLSPNDVFLAIHVQMKPRMQTQYGWAFE